MAIKREEITQTTLTDNERTLVDIVEKDIDRFLIKNYKNNMLFYSILHRKLRHPVLYEIEKRYKEAGWEVLINRENLLKRALGNGYYIRFWKWPASPKRTSISSGGIVDTL